MLIFSKVNKSRAGFTLIEALVALSVAAVFLPVILRGFTNAWNTLKIAADTENSMRIARSLAAEWRDEAGNIQPSGDFHGYQYKIASEGLQLEPRDAQLPPAPPKNPATKQDAAAAQSAAEAAPPQGQLLRLVILVTAPSGRTLRYETAKLQFPSNAGP